jgi:hypothetical protein
MPADINHGVMALNKAARTKFFCDIRRFLFFPVIIFLN